MSPAGVLLGGQETETQNERQLTVGNLGNGTGLGLWNTGGTLS